MIAVVVVGTRLCRQRTSSYASVTDMTCLSLNRRM
jgi:hypothetical protein